MKYGRVRPHFGSRMILLDACKRVRDWTLRTRTFSFRPMAKALTSPTHTIVLSIF